MSFVTTWKFRARHDFHCSPEQNASTNASHNFYLNTFATKCLLPPEIPNEYSAIGGEAFASDYVLLLRTRYVKRALRKLNMDSDTGPGGINALVLHTCAAELAYTLSMLIRKMLATC